MPLSVLLVDDDPIVREVLGAQLRALGHAVAVAADVRAACDLAGTQEFEVLLIDQRLDGADGIDLLRRLRAIAGTQGARGIAISAELDSLRAAELRSAGFDATLPKPTDLAGLRAVLGSDDPHGPLDDTAALAIWGSMETVRMLRAMLRDELPVYRDLIRAAADARNDAALREVLHRMRSSAGFCGALPLTTFIDDTPHERIDWTDLLVRYDAACGALMPALQAASAP
jgi:CheY-like chemotaxis protein